MKTKREPQVGDVWEIRRPGRRKLTKEIGSIFLQWMDKTGHFAGNRKQVPWVSWRRAAKGRYTGISVSRLLECGKLISTARQRKRKQDALFAKWDFDDRLEVERKLLYSMIVAGKSADFTDKALQRFIDDITGVCRQVYQISKPTLPFDLLRLMKPADIVSCLRFARTGNYTKLANGIADILRIKPDLDKCQPADLEVIHGIGPKTSRFFIMWIRPKERFAALDVHVLRWLAKRPECVTMRIPKATPQSSAQYAKLEKLFLSIADKIGKTPRELDEEIWTAGAGRTQQTTKGN